MTVTLVGNYAGQLRYVLLHASSFILSIRAIFVSNKPKSKPLDELIHMQQPAIRQIHK